MTVLLRQTICDHLRRARLEKNPQRIPANTPPVFPSLRPRIWPHLLRLVTKAMSDRLLARMTHERVCDHRRSAALTRRS